MEGAGIQEGGAVGEHTPEGEEGARPSSAHHREQRDAVAADLQSDIVMDDLCEALVLVAFQQAAGGVNDVRKRSAKGLVLFDHLKGVHERDLSGLIKEVRELVKGVIHQVASQVHRRRRHVYPDRAER